MAKVSVIYTHWGMDEKRCAKMRASLYSLIVTAPEAEIIVVDNGGSFEDSKWLLSLAEKGQIACYVRNRKNMHFGYARNQGLKLASGDYLVICDNDIIFSDKWVDECVEFLEKHDGKYIATPIACDPMNATRAVRWVGEVDGWKLNTRAGSNVFMLRRKDFETIGFFDLHRIAGSLYCDRFCRLGYVVAIMPVHKAVDSGFREGYNFKEDIPNKTL